MFHIKNGKIQLCAKIRTCTYGDHFETVDEARRALGVTTSIDISTL